MTDIVERLRVGARGGYANGWRELALEAADEIERLTEERDDWRQAAKVEAGLRREFLAEIERLGAEHESYVEWTQANLEPKA